MTDRATLNIDIRVCPADMGSLQKACKSTCSEFYKFGRAIVPCVVGGVVNFFVASQLSGCFKRHEFIEKMIDSRTGYCFPDDLAGRNSLISYAAAAVAVYATKKLIDVVENKVAGLTMSASRLQSNPDHDVV